MSKTAPVACSASYPADIWFKRPASSSGATLGAKPLWAEFWWIEGEHRWVFFDDEKTSESYGEELTHCPECGRLLERKGLRARTPSLLP
jgi:hypothetical protein